jgi:hypothetical protein
LTLPLIVSGKGIRDINASTHEFRQNATSNSETLVVLRVGVVPKLSFVSRRSAQLNVESTDLALAQCGNSRNDLIVFHGCDRVLDPGGIKRVVFLAAHVLIEVSPRSCHIGYENNLRYLGVELVVGNEVNSFSNSLYLPILCPRVRCLRCNRVNES